MGAWLTTSQPGLLASLPLRATRSAGKAFHNVEITNISPISNGCRSSSSKRHQGGGGMDLAILAGKGRKRPQAQDSQYNNYFSLSSMFNN